MSSDIYPPRSKPWPDKSQPYTYGNQGDNDGGIMPNVSSTGENPDGGPDYDPDDDIGNDEV